jgi:hypothetical protein
MSTGAEVPILLDTRLYRCFYRRNGNYNLIGRDLWNFLRELSSVKWNNMEVKLGEQLTWYAILNHYGVYDLIVLTVNIG